MQNRFPLHLCARSCSRVSASDPRARLQVCEMPELEALDVECNVIAVLPPGLGNLALLTELRLSYNQLESLPAELSRLSRLTLLEAKYNFLAHFPPAIAHLPLQTVPHAPFLSSCCSSLAAHRLLAACCLLLAAYRLPLTAYR